MNDKPTLADLLGKNEATRLVEMSKAMGEALSIMFSGGKTVHPFHCQTCKEVQVAPEATLSRCNYCGEPTCFACRDTGRHKHDERSEAIAFIFCLPCGKVQPIGSTHDAGYVPKDKNDTPQPCCSVCKFVWAPRAIRGVDYDNKHQAICSFCGAFQEFITLPFWCGRCASKLL